MMKTLRWALVLACTLQTPTLLADASLWHDMEAKDTEPAGLQQRLLALDEATLQALVLHTSAPPQLSLPLAAGGFAAVQLVPVTTLAPDIAARYPDWRTWRVEGLDGKVRSGRAELTELGFTAMLTMANGDTLFIDPSSTTTQAAARHYRSLSKRANAEHFQADYQCTTHQRPTPSSFQAKLTEPVSAARAGDTLHIYDIAVGATGEYTQYHGGTRTAALSAITTTINRINEIYQRDLSIQLRLVSDTNTIFADPTIDPYTDDNSLLGQNQKVLDLVIGNSKYDIGHVFSTGNGGVAVVKSLCDNDYKAYGMSSWDKPQGDTFAIDFVAHELGHQLGATHTFNSNKGSCSGNSRIQGTAYEPGSGNTIMAYAGLCSPDNVQNNSDAMFHAGSISQITSYAHNGEGVACASTTPLNNQNPVANAGSDYTIPARTPFVLTGSATDLNNDTLSYSWEQMDAGSASGIDVDLSNNALVRTHMPSASPSRTIPRLSDLFTGTHTLGETVPSSSRTMNFRLQVRDGKGGLGHDDMSLKVVDTGAVFSITAPSSANLVAGAKTDVTWNVAKTNEAPIACDKVDIGINVTGTDSTFQTLLAGTENDGAASVTLPTTLGTRNTLILKCTNNIFFALSGSTAATGETSSSDSSSDGGGGSFPLGLVILGALAFWRRLLQHKGV